MVLPSQNIVRAATPSRFTCFSWSTGLNSYTGYIAPSTSSLAPQNTNLIVPFRANNTGNFLGWYEVKGKKTNATPVVAGRYDLHDNSYIMNGELNTNEGTMNNRFAIYSTSGNAVIYMDYVRTNMPCTITTEKGGLMTISVDEMTATKRTLYTQDGNQVLDGSSFTTMHTPWVNIDNSLGIITLGGNKQMAFGERANNNSVLTAKLYTLYNDTERTYERNTLVSKRAVVYYCNTTAENTKKLYADSKQLETPEGWNGVIAPDSLGAYLFISNFDGKITEHTIGNVQYPLVKDGETLGMWAPVFNVETYISNSHSTAKFYLEHNRSFGQPINFFIKGDNVIASSASESMAYVTARKNTTITMAVCVDDMEKLVIKEVKLKAGQTVTIKVENGDFMVM